MISTFEELVALASESGRAMQVDSLGKTILLSSGEGELEPLIVRWESSLPFVHVLQPMLGEVPAEHASTIATAICRINHLAKFPGLAYDDRSGAIYYRITIVRLEDGVRRETVVGMIRGATANAKEVFAAMRAAASGASVEETVKLAGG